MSLKFENVMSSYVTLTFSRPPGSYCSILKWPYASSSQSGDPPVGKSYPCGSRYAMDQGSSAPRTWMSTLSVLEKPAEFVTVSRNSRFAPCGGTSGAVNCGRSEEHTSE